MRRGGSGRGRRERRAEIPQAAPQPRPCIPTPLVPACETRCRCPSPSFPFCSPTSFYPPCPLFGNLPCCKITAPCPWAWCCGVGLTAWSHREPPPMCICFYHEEITLGDPLFPVITTAPRYSISAAAKAPDSSAGYDGMSRGGGCWC